MALIDGLKRLTMWVHRSWGGWWLAAGCRWRRRLCWRQGVWCGNSGVGTVGPWEGDGWVSKVPTILLYVGQVNHKAQWFKGQGVKNDPLSVTQRCDQRREPQRRSAGLSDLRDLTWNEAAQLHVYLHHQSIYQPFPVNIKIRSVRGRGKGKVRKYAPCLSERGEILSQQLPWGPVSIQDESSSECA